jgi:hypothetical protein
MTALRSDCTPSQRQAHAILDDVRAGMWHSPMAVTWALRALGDL